MTLIFGLISSNKASAATISPSASLTIASKTLSASVSPGDIGYVSSNVTYSATDTTSYTLRATYADGNSNLASGNNTVAGVANGTTGSTMASSNINAWGFAWGNTTDSNESLAYYTMPAYGSTGTDITSGVVDSGTSITSTTKKIVFAAKFANNNGNMGSYKTNILLSLVATPKATYNYTLSYSMNGGTGTISPQSITNQDTTTYSFTVSSTQPTRAGYEFLGWSESSDAITATYTGGSTITVKSTALNKLLYAVWQGTSTSFPSTLTTMQGMTPEICRSVKIGTSKTLTDSRDSKTYTISKLADYRCWMTQNLALDLSKANVASKANSDNLSASFPSTALPNRFDTSTTNIWEDDNTIAQFSKSPAKIFGTDTQPYKSTYGYYYSWCAATAGTCSSSSSICPNNWVLPTGASGTKTNDFAMMAGITTSVSNGTNYWNSVTPTPTFSNGVLTIKNNTWVAAGRVESFGLMFTDKAGYYWARNPYGTDSARDLYFTSSGSPDFQPVSYAPRYEGLSVRCIAK